MSAGSFTDWSISCDHPGCDIMLWASNVADTAHPTAAAARKALKPRGWVVNVPVGDGSRKRKDYCPHHNPDLAVRVRAALACGGFAEFGSRAEAGKIALDAPGPEGSWRSLVTEQCADHLGRLGFTTEVTDGVLYVTGQAPGAAGPSR